MKEVLDKLRQIRRSKNISVEEVHKYLLKNDIQVAKKTIYGYDCGFTTPSIKTFILMCKLYGIKNIYDLFKEEKTNINISPITNEEKEVIEKFRKKKEYQDAILKLLDLKKESNT